MAPTTPSPQGKKTVSSASKDAKTAASPKAAKSEGGSPIARNGEGSSRAWTAEEDAVFYQAMMRIYKPNWPEIMSALNSVAEERGEPARTNKSAQLRYERAIKRLIALPVLSASALPVLSSTPWPAEHWMDKANAVRKIG
ncbi:hypothetical protein BDZ90DRAFT_262230 [Jaminaea rosea]|uniref:Myb-like domain-containing protein n=1 Tax=Jaminaea rosea TaxID=1569628 RepID=A0A316UNU5_9BASI|nr:hypothetical protein BDZ90DRAFT_262230 [Jaminaea rosea]PWN25583.1 hypothetical protein BDZ90DRAFT_262230 [Jaminaea rosea]